MSTLHDDLRTLSYEAYVYFYPLLTMDVTRRQLTGAPADTKPGFGPANEFHHMREFPPADFRAVVRPNFDTLYSSVWLDLTAGPVVIHVPDAQDRYYLLPMLDMWTDVFAAPGKRTTGTGAGEFAIVGPGGGSTPDGVPVITATTPYVWIIGRTQTNGPKDYPNVNAFQDGLSITAPATPSVSDPVDPSGEPLSIVNEMSAIDYLTYAAELLKTIPPHATDFSQLMRLELLGIEVGKSFDASRFDDGDRAEIEAGAKAALHDMTASLAHLGTSVDGWTVLTETMGVYGDAYFRRAVVTMVGLGANQPEDAIYPLLTADADGDVPVGGTDYVLHFDAGGLPPAGAFWSVTMYDVEGFQVANELNRFAIGDRDPLVFNADGSLDLYLQHANPGADKEANWLPSPDSGPLGITLRLYAPDRMVLEGSWTPPPLRKA